MLRIHFLLFTRTFNRLHAWVANPVRYARRVHGVHGVETGLKPGERDQLNSARDLEAQPRINEKWRM